jgi:hypothetical protein
MLRDAVLFPLLPWGGEGQGEEGWQPPTSPGSLTLATLSPLKGGEGWFSKE